MPDEDGVSIELVREVIASLKKGKACGVDQVESEAWMWATDECIRVLAGFLDEIWRGTREWPESWNQKHHFDFHIGRHRSVRTGSRELLLNPAGHQQKF
ncbi:hypothetical protein QE152_g9196 [Popillia japonica]|uniref:Uncharacterized protein n=1 Tax=Popillia japonica TaxID=7064 RepID=A0AAW1M0D9_POPJA